MATVEKKPVYTLAADEKVASVMIYLVGGLCWGEVVVKELIRVSTWLRTNSAPDTVRLYNAKYMVSTPGSKPIALPEMHLTATQLLAYHLIPPAKDPLDYDPSEPNRKMEMVTVLIGGFRMDGLLRMASITNLARYIEVTRETYTGLYEVDISNPTLPMMGTMHVPFMLVRQATAVFATRA